MPDTSADYLNEREIAARIGVTRRELTAIKESPDFPKPAMKLPLHRLPLRWLASDIESYIRTLRV